MLENEMEKHEKKENEKKNLSTKSEIPRELFILVFIVNSIEFLSLRCFLNFSASSPFPLHTTAPL